MIFVLEDMETRLKWFRSHWPSMEYSASPAEAAEFLRSHPNLEVIFLDHDLGGEPYKRGLGGDGIDLAEIMARESLHLDTKIIIHSCNSVGAKNMMAALRGHHDVHHIPYPTLRETIDKC